MEALNGFKMSEVLVDSVDNGLILRDDARVGDELAAGRGGDSLLADPSLESREVGRDESGGELVAIADEGCLSDEEIGLELVFNGLRGDKFAARSLEQLLLAICNVEETVRVQAADVSGAEEPLIVEDLGGVRRLLPVALEDIRAFHEKLAIFGEAAGDVGKSLADGTHTVVPRRVDGKDRRGLREAVAFEDAN